MISFKREIRRLSGQINGQLTLVTTSELGVKIDGSLVYIDDHNQKRMLNGDDPSKPYVHNTKYDGNSVLGIISAGDIIYSKDVPDRLEINASMMSTQGKVAFEGMVVSEDGNSVGTTMDAELYPKKYQKESIRRLGGIACRFRPIFTLVDGSNQVRAGFAKGVSHMDGRLLLKGGTGTLPPFAPVAYRPNYAVTSLGMKIPTQVH
jgi:hypothetical protein